VVLSVGEGGNAPGKQTLGEDEELSNSCQFYVQETEIATELNVEHQLAHSQHPTVQFEQQRDDQTCTEHFDSSNTAAAASAAMRSTVTTNTTNILRSNPLPSSTSDVSQGPSAASHLQVSHKNREMDALTDTNAAPSSLESQPSSQANGQPATSNPGTHSHHADANIPTTSPVRPLDAAEAGAPPGGFDMPSCPPTATILGNASAASPGQQTEKANMVRSSGAGSCADGEPPNAQMQVSLLQHYCCLEPVKQSSTCLQVEQCYACPSHSQGPFCTFTGSIQGCLQAERQKEGQEPE
jgi:hypothetical protein